MIEFSYLNNFEELNIIGSGGFGQVFKVRDKVDEQYYAIKKIFNQEITDVLREAKTFAKLNGDRVVRYMHSWVENDCVFIKMEYCSDNLKNLINQKCNYFNRMESEPLSALEFYISTQIFKELVECVQYLHELQPPIIHRDIKPQNILISKNQKNRNCLKLCDFGLATFHDISSIYHTNGVGTFVYMAPEVPKGKYNCMADIYSLGKVAEELFDIDINLTKIYENIILNEKMNLMTTFVVTMVGYAYSKRPNCHQILEKLKRFSMKNSEIKNCTDFELMISDLSNKILGDSIFLDYLENLHQPDDTELDSNQDVIDCAGQNSNQSLPVIEPPIAEPVPLQTIPVQPIEAQVPQEEEKELSLDRKVEREVKRIGKQFRNLF